MTTTDRPRRLALLALTGAAALALAACSSTDYPNSIFTQNTEVNTDVGHLFNRLFLFGTIVFVLVEALLLYAIFRFRAKPGQGEPEHVHGNTTLEVLWTAIPAVILLFIAVPTVRTIFRTQAKARAGALEVEVIGHQWWWEFKYPQYTTTRANGKVDTLTTANEIYFPAGRTVNFKLRTADVIHSFWIPALSGKRDVMPNHTNYIWFTPDSALGAAVWNGHCAEYCGVVAREHEVPRLYRHHRAVRQLDARAARAGGVRRRARGSDDSGAGRSDRRLGRGARRLDAGRRAARPESAGRDQPAAG